MIVRFTPGGRRQFLAVMRYIAEHNPPAAERFRMRAEKVLRRLEDFPHSGRRLPEFPELPHREVIVRPYRFFYRVSGNLVWVVSVWHGAQVPKKPRTGARRPTPIRPGGVKGTEVSGPAARDRAVGAKPSRAHSPSSASDFVSSIGAESATLHQQSRLSL